MDPQIPTSFIPKKSFDTGSVRGGGSGGGTGLVVLIAILIFVASVVGAGGVFAYSKLLHNSIENKAKSLALNQKAYDPGVIQELIRVDARLSQAANLLEKHVAPTAIFAFLAQQTLEKVQFTSFDYMLETDGTATIAMSGLADTFSTVALQSDQFGASKVLKDVVFSDIDTELSSGKIGFEVSATIDVPFILYTKQIAEGSNTPQQQIVQPTSTSTATTTP